MQLTPLPLLKCSLMTLWIFATGGHLIKVLLEKKCMHAWKYLGIHYACFYNKHLHSTAKLQPVTETNDFLLGRTALDRWHFHYSVCYYRVM